MRFENRGNVVVSVDCLSLTSREVTIDEADATIIDDHAENKSAFIAAMSTHPSFQLGGVDVVDSTPKRRFDEYTSEETNQTSRVQKDIALSWRHEVINAPCEMVPPNAVLATHVFLIIRILLLTLEQRLSRNFLVLQIYELLEAKDEDVSGIW